MAEDYNSIGFRNKDIDKLRQVQQDTIKPKINPAELARQKRAEVEKLAQAKRAEIIRKKDSILDRNAAAQGLTREQVRSRQEADKNKPDAKLPGIEGQGNKRGGSCGAAESKQKELNKR